jgi:16S rRNA U516 pseudouridylate synthase RsuA-like enzyme
VLGAQTVLIDGQPLARPPFHRLLLLHKPKGCLSTRPRTSGAAVASTEMAAAGAESGDASSTSTSEPVQTVYDLVPAELGHRTLGPFGRLD